MAETRAWMIGAAALGCGLLVFIVVTWLQPSPLLAASIGAVVTASSVVAAAVLPLRLLVPQDHNTDAADQRDTLVQALTGLTPQLPDGLAWQATNALSAVGVRAVVPDGMRADPNAHHIVGTEVASDATRVDTVARTIRPGFSDGERVVVYPKVIVYAPNQARP